MRSAVVTDFTSPLEIQELPIPEPGPGQVLVRIAAFAAPVRESIGTHDSAMAVRGDLRLLHTDLDGACGALTEISTVWRRAHQGRPELPLGLPGQLRDAIRELAASAEALIDDGPGQPTDLAFVLARRLAAACKDITEAEAMTCGAGASPLGDAGLWNMVGAAMHLARNRLLALILRLTLD